MRVAPSRPKALGRQRCARESWLVSAALALNVAQVGQSRWQSLLVSESLVSQRVAAASVGRSPYRDPLVSLVSSLRVWRMQRILWVRWIARWQWLLTIGGRRAKAGLHMRRNGRQRRLQCAQGHI